MLQVGLRARIGRLTQPARQSAAGRLVLDVQRVGDELVADDLRDAALALDRVCARRILRERAPADRQRERSLETRQREALDHARDVLRLGALGAQKFATRRHVEEQIANFDRRADRMWRRLDAR